MPGVKVTLTQSGSNPYGVFIGGDGASAGKYLFIVERNTDTIQRYTLTTAWDLADGISYDHEYYVGGDVSTPNDVAFNDTGTKMFVLDGSTKEIYEYSVSTAWDLSGTVTYSGSTFDPETATGDSLNSYSIHWTNSGQTMYYADITNDRIYMFEYSTTAWDVTDLGYTASDYVGVAADGAGYPLAVYAKSGNIYVMDSLDGLVYEYSMTGWDVTTASYTDTFDYTAAMTAGAATGMFFSSDGTKMYIVESGADELHQYTLGTAWDVSTAEYNVPLTGDGTASLSLTTSGAGTVHHIYGDATAINLSLSASGTGSGELHGDAPNVPISLTLSATGTGAVHGDASIELSVTLPVAQGIALPTMAVAATLPSFTGTAEGGAYDPPDIMLPSLTLSAVGLAGNVLKNSNTGIEFRSLPSLTISASFGNTTDMEIPSLTITATAVGSTLATTNIDLPKLQLTGEFGADRIASLDQSLPVFVSRGTIARGTESTADLEIQVEIQATGLSGSVSTATFEITALTVDGTAISERLYSGSAELPVPHITAILGDNVTVTYTGFSMNTENFYTSEYDNYGYLALATVFGQNLAIGPDGIFDMSGDDDEGTDIDADVLFGFDSFRTEDSKRVPVVYLGYEADNDGDLVVQIVVDGEPAVREYAVQNVEHSSGQKRGRAKIAKGLKSRYWQYGVKNVNGADFRLDDLSIPIMQFTRKVF